MKLKRVQFRNFKLLRHVTVELSTDPDRPLTVLRAENGSGKTSLLWGLSWAFYGFDGLPSKNARLTSTDRPAGEATTVQVIVDFEHDDGTGSCDYILTRSIDETPGKGDDVEHGVMITTLHRRLPAGEEEVPGSASAVLETFVPKRLMNVFLTNGDDVQHFISGNTTTKERQHRVHDAIRSLLGLDHLEEVEKDLTAIERDFRKEVASTAGQDVQAAQEALDATEDNLAEVIREREAANLRRERIDEDILGLEKKLHEIQGNGDLTSINAAIDKAAADLAGAEADESRLFEDIRTEFKSSEVLSWSLAGEKLRQGQKVLADLAERGVIPGSSLGVLQDRLDLRTCICGESLDEGTSHREHVSELLDEQKAISEERMRLTSTFHRTRAGLEHFEAACEDERDFLSQRPGLLQRHTAIRDSMLDAQQRLAAEKKKREAIDEEEIQRLTERLSKAQKSLKETSEHIGGLERDVRTAEQARDLAQVKYNNAEKTSKSDEKATQRLQVAHDLKTIVSRSLATLKTEHVQQVSTRMNAIFMEIVGSDPELAGAVFKGVRLTEDFNIVVDTGASRTLDPDFELNGASQRALTLAFIWALMEVSATIAPRVIDTPLGMTAGAVKQRMVDAITEPVTGEKPDYQVVLLLTRSEIRDIEDLLDDRAATFVTLSCSKDYPRDLCNDWDVEEPTIRECACSHRQFCEICERRIDKDHNLTRRA